MIKIRTQFHIIALVIFSFASFTIGAFSLTQSVTAEENPCLPCHAKINDSQFIHAAVALGCQTCHKPVEGKSHPDQQQSIMLVQDMPGLCFTCHTQAKFQDKVMHTPVQTGTCTGCHDPHSSNIKKILRNKMPQLCYNCHKESNFQGKYDHAPVIGGMCPACHAPHSSPNEKLLLTPTPEVCYTCHEKSKFNKKNVHAVVAMGCNSCHEAHKGEYPYLLLNNVQPLCLGCHTNKNDGRHVVSIPGKRPHPISGIPDPSTTVMITVVDPANPKKSRIIPDPDNPGQMMNCLSCHNPHSSDYRKLFPTGRICKKCHKDY